MTMPSPRLSYPPIPFRYGVINPFPKTRPPQASVLKNAGLAYLNLVRSPRQPGVGGTEEDDVLIFPADPLGATSLLPWETAAIVAAEGISSRGHVHNDDDDHYHQQRGGEQGLAFSDYDDEDGGAFCPPFYERDTGARSGGGGGGGAVKAFDPSNPSIALATPSGTAAALHRLEKNGNNLRDGGKSRAVGNWRNEASMRFMLLWKHFLEHEDARLDNQYGTIRAIYEQLADRFGMGAPTEGR